MNGRRVNQLPSKLRMTNSPKFRASTISQWTDSFQRPRRSPSPEKCLLSRLEDIKWAIMSHQVWKLYAACCDLKYSRNWALWRVSLRDWDAAGKSFICQSFTQYQDTRLPVLKFVAFYIFSQRIKFLTRTEKKRSYFSKNCNFFWNFRWKRMTFLNLF